MTEYTIMPYHEIPEIINSLDIILGNENPNDYKLELLKACKMSYIVEISSMLIGIK